MQLSPADDTVLVFEVLYRFMRKTCDREPNNHEEKDLLWNVQAELVSSASLHTHYVLFLWGSRPWCRNSQSVRVRYWTKTLRVARSALMLIGFKSGKITFPTKRLLPTTWEGWNRGRRCAGFRWSETRLRRPTFTITNCWLVMVRDKYSQWQFVFPEVPLINPFLKGKMTNEQHKMYIIMSILVVVLLKVKVLKVQEYHTNVSISLLVATPKPLHPLSCTCILLMKQ